jgi:NAD(P)-dependent dehydrogenase (short-subunit alcohol dehydrogenase family)
LAATCKHLQVHFRHNQKTNMVEQAQILQGLRIGYAIFLFVETIVLAAVGLPFIIANSIGQVLYSLAVDAFEFLKLDIKNKHVFITGCDTGFGFAVAKRLHDSGVNVHANCYSEDGAKNLKNATSSKLRTYVFDVTDDSAVITCKEQIDKELAGQPLWAVINNAGIANHCFVEGTSLQEFRRVLAVNTLAMICVCKEFLPLLRRDLKNPGRIINVTSVAGRVAAPGMAAYAASKFAAEGFSDSLRRELMYFGVPVTIIEPGFFRTNIVMGAKSKIAEAWDQLPEELKKAYEKTHKKNVGKITGFMEKIAEDPSVVVTEIVRNVYSRWPLTRALVGWQALFLLPGSFAAPTAVSDIPFVLGNMTQ